VSVVEFQDRNHIRKTNWTKIFADTSKSSSPIVLNLKRWLDHCESLCDVLLYNCGNKIFNKHMYLLFAMLLTFRFMCLLLFRLSLTSRAEISWKPIAVITTFIWQKFSFILPHCRAYINYRRKMLPTLRKQIYPLLSTSCRLFTFDTNL
jgi:hypothetical protein